MSNKHVSHCCRQSDPLTWSWLQNAESICLHRTGDMYNKTIRRRQSDAIRILTSPSKSAPRTFRGGNVAYAFYRCFLNEPSSGCECFQSDTLSNTHSTAQGEPRTWMWALWGCQGRSSAALWYRRAKWKPAVEMESAEKKRLACCARLRPSLPVITAENMAHRGLILKWKLFWLEMPRICDVLSLRRQFRFPAN